MGVSKPVHESERRIGKKSLPKVVLNDNGIGDASRFFKERRGSAVW